MIGKQQQNQILKYLVIHETMTTIEARALGIMSPAPRIMELRRDKWPIGMSWYKQVDHAGVEHKQGQYYLPTEKLSPEQKKIAQAIFAD